MWTALTVVTNALRCEAHGREESLRGEFYVIQPGSSVQVLEAFMSTVASHCALRLR